MKYTRLKKSESVVCLKCLAFESFGFVVKSKKRSLDGQKFWSSKIA